MRSARGAAARSIGQALNLTSYTSHTCPPGYHWVDTPQGPIMGLKRGNTHTVARLAACVPNPATPPAAPPPPPKTIPFRLGTPPAPAPPAPPAPVATTPAPRFQTFAAKPTAITPATFTQPAAAAEQPSTPAAPACDCWPLWWLLVPLAAGAAAGYMLTGKDGKKRRKNAARYVVRHVVQRIPNPIAALGF